MAAPFLSSPQTKRAYNRSLFEIVAPRYFVATRVLSFFRDAAWKRRAVSMVPDDIPAGPMVDVASGSGDLAALLVARFASRRCVTVDLTMGMTRLAARRLDGRALVTVQDMCRVGLRDSSAAVVSGGYALRNAPDLAAALGETFRLMVPGGVAVFLDFSRSPAAPVAFVQNLVLKAWGWLWGLLLHGRPSVYGYIADSLAAYPDRSELHSLCGRAGFSVAGSERKMFGLMEILLLKKPAPATTDGETVQTPGSLRAATASRTTQPWWPDLSVRCRDKELMDLPDAVVGDLWITLAAFRTINFFITPFRRMFRFTILSDARKRGLTKVIVCDIGAGGGDVGLWCGRELRRAGMRALVLQVDADWRVARFLKKASSLDAGTRVICADAAALCLKPGTVDYVVSNHMLHHCDERDILAILRNVRDAARYGFLVSDLVRSLAAYVGFRVLAALFFRRGFTLYDGLLSIRRGFTLDELDGLVNPSGAQGRVRLGRKGIGHFCAWSTGGALRAPRAGET